jgi:hypothetical protein
MQNDSIERDYAWPTADSTRAPFCTNPDCGFARIKMAAYNIYFRQDEKAAAKGELTLHIGNGKQRAGIIARSWPRPNVYTRLGGSPQSGSARRPGANVVRLQADHLDRG